MVGIYFKTLHIPVRFLIYVCITAMTRMLVGSTDVANKADYELLILSGAILLLAVAGLVVRYASFRFQSVAEPPDTMSVAGDTAQSR